MGKKVFIDLTHPFSAEIPRWPYFDKPVIDNNHTMAKGGVLTQKITCVQHTGTHCDAPRHVMEIEFDGKRARYTHECPSTRTPATPCACPSRSDRWGLIGPKHLEAACEKVGIKPRELEGMIVCLNTGMHRKFDDSKEYYHYSCGTGVEAGKWFVEHKLKCVAMDSQALDHPLHTAMGNNGMTRMNLVGATGKPITEEYIELFGQEAYAEFDKELYIKLHGKEAYDRKSATWRPSAAGAPGSPATSKCWVNGIVGVENLGGDLDKVSGKRFRFYCFPLRWYMATAPWRAAWPKLTRTTSTTCRRGRIPTAAVSEAG